jgi:hypothetical protein
MSCDKNFNDTAKHIIEIFIVERYTGILDPEAPVWRISFLYVGGGE